MKSGSPSLAGDIMKIKIYLIQPVDTKGRAIYVIDISNGNLIWSYSNANNSNMKYCIPSDIARVDTDGDR